MTSDAALVAGAAPGAAAAFLLLSFAFLFAHFLSTLLIGAVAAWPADHLGVPADAATEAPRGAGCSCTHPQRQSTSCGPCRCGRRPRRPCTSHCLPCSTRAFPSPPPAAPSAFSWQRSFGGSSCASRGDAGRPTDGHRGQWGTAIARRPRSVVTCGTGDARRLTRTDWRCRSRVRGALCGFETS